MDFDYKKIKNSHTVDKSVYVCTPIQFCFVGPRGVGKSSLLASMYHELETEKKLDNFYIDIRTETGRRTQARLAVAKEKMLRMITESAPYATAEPNLGLESDDELNIFEFVGRNAVEDHSFLGRRFGNKRKEFHFPFRFVDMPGGWYQTERIDDDTAAEVRGVLEASAVSFLTIDTPALMADASICHSNNKVDTIKSWYENSLDSLRERGHTVVLVLSRCERYRADIPGMMSRLRSTYAVLIRKLKAAQIRVYATYVQTLGGMEFETYERVQHGALEIERARFIRVGDYAPQNCSTPLALALQHGLLQALRNMQHKKSNNRLVAWCAALGWNNIDQAIQAAEGLVEALHSHVHTDEAYTYEEL